MGIFLGLSVYMKQQAGLLTLGAAALFLGRLASDRSARHGWPHLVVIPLVALAALSLGLLAEGRGWVPWQRGLQWAAGYGREGSLLLNLYTQVRGDESAALAAGLSVLAWCGLWRLSPRGERLTQPAIQVASLGAPGLPVQSRAIRQSSVWSLHAAGSSLPRHRLPVAGARVLDVAFPADTRSRSWFCS